MGIVYLAVDGSGHQVALKLIRPELVTDAGFRGRFRREVEAAQRVGGICNARYLDADLDSEHPYLVTEYVEGGNLLDFVAAHGPLVGDQLVGLAVGLAEALVAMGAVGVIHRDLKPTNVLMSPRGPKVVDFGISHAADGTSLTQTSNVVGSPGWMAPEQALGTSTTPAIDVFSWGATVVFASTGRAPFGEGRPEAVLYRVVHEPPDLDGLDPRLIPSVGQALQKDPTARPSADQLLVDLVKTAMAGSFPPGGSVAMATVVLDRTWHQGLHSRTWEGPPETSRRRRRVAWIAAAAFVVIAGLIAGGVFALGHSNKSASANKATPTTTHKGGAASTVTTKIPATSPSSSSTQPSSQSPAALESAALPLVACPTSYGVEPSASPPVLPASISESVPTDLASQLAVYTDQRGEMKLLAPTGWVCNASYGADGSGGVSAYPSGETLPSGHLTSDSTAEAIVGSETSACAGCAQTQASPLFSTAAADCAQNYPGSCGTLPSGESEEQIKAGVVGFLDPPGVAGDGNPSGGEYPANGVMTYHSGDDNGSWLDTCTLPYSQRALCTAVLNNFAQMYGSD